MTVIVKLTNYNGIGLNIYINIHTYNIKELLFINSINKSKNYLHFLKIYIQFYHVKGV